MAAIKEVAASPAWSAVAVSTALGQSAKGKGDYREGAAADAPALAGLIAPVSARLRCVPFPPFPPPRARPLRMRRQSIY